MVTNTIKRTTSSNKNNEIQGARFLEDLSWLFQSHKGLDIKVLANILKDAATQKSVTQGITSFASPNPNIHFLVGVIPLILRDETIFSTNASIADFALSTLGINMTRYDKKSRFELIGEIACNAIDLNDDDLSKLVQALSILANGDISARKIVSDAQDSRRGWNEIIQKLLAERQ